MTLERVEAKLLPLGFIKIPKEEDDSVEILASYGFNYCLCCKRSDATISIFKQIIDPEDGYLEEFPLQISVNTQNGSFNEDLTTSSLNEGLKELKEYGLIFKKK
jgi:hypothetical protein